MVVKTYFELIELNICNYLFDYWLLFCLLIFSPCRAHTSLQFRRHKASAWEQCGCTLRVCACLLCWTGLKLLCFVYKCGSHDIQNAQTNIIQFNMSSADSVLAESIWYDSDTDVTKQHTSNETNERKKITFRKAVRKILFRSNLMDHFQTICVIALAHLFHFSLCFYGLDSSSFSAGNKSRPELLKWPVL